MEPCEFVIDENGVVWLVDNSGSKTSALPVLVDVPGTSHYGCLRVKKEEEA